MERDWDVRGVLDTELAGPKRYKHGFAKIASRLDTKTLSVMVSLTAEGHLTLRLAKLGLHPARVRLQGRLELVGESVRFIPSSPQLGFSGE